MATPVELERLIVKLEGDNRGFKKMVDQSIISMSVFKSWTEINTRAIKTWQEEVKIHADKAIKNAVTPLERYAREVQNLQALLRLGAISQKEYTRNVEQLHAKLPSTRQEMKAFNQTIRDQVSVQKEATRARREYEQFILRHYKEMEKAGGESARRTANEQIAAAREVEREMKRIQKDQLRMAKELEREEKRVARETARAAVAASREKARAEAQQARAHRQTIRDQQAVARQEKKDRQDYEKFILNHYKKQERAERELTKVIEKARMDQIRFEKRVRAERDASMKKLATMTGNMMTTAGQRGMIGVTAPVIAGGTASVNQFSAFDDAMTGSLAVMEDITPRMREQMEELAKTISDRSITSAEELAKAYYFLASAGYEAEAAQRALTHVEKFAVAGRFDMEKATSLLADTQAALGMRTGDLVKDEENLIKVSDVLVKADTIANASVEQFARSLVTKAGNALRLLNKDVEEGVAVLAAYAKQGVKAELAGERLYIVLRDLERTSRVNSQEWEHFGLRVYDAQGKMKPLVQIIRQMEGLMGKMSDQEKAATFGMLGFQDRSVAAIKGLIGMSDQIEAYEAQLRSASGYTDKVATKQLESFAAQMKITWNQIRNVAIEIGHMLAPSILKLGQYVREQIRWWGGLTEEQRMSHLQWIAIAAAIPPIILVGGQVITTIKNIGVALVALKTVMVSTGLAANGLQAATYGLAVVGIAALSYGIYRALPSIRAWNRELERGKQLTQTGDKGLSRRHAINLRDAGAIQDQAKKHAFLTETLRREETELKGYQNQVEQVRAQVKRMEELHWFDGTFAENLTLTLQREQLAALEGKLVKQKEHVDALTDSLYEVDQAQKQAGGFNLAGMEEGEGIGLEEPDFKEMERVADMVKDLEVEAATLGLTDEEVKVYKLALMGASEAQIKTAMAAAETVKAFEAEEKALKKATEAAEKFVTPMEKFKLSQAELDDLLKKGLISLAGYQYHLRELRLETMKDFSTNLRAGIEVTEAGSAESVARREEAIYASLERRRYASMMEAGKREDPRMEPKREDSGKIGATTATGTDRLIELLAEIARNTSKDEGAAGRRPKQGVPVPANFRERA